MARYSTPRSSNDPPARSINFGFRLALSLSGVTPEAATVKGAEPSGRHGGSVSGAATGEAVAGWRSGFDTRSHAPRGNAVFDAPRRLLKLRTTTHVTQPLSIRRSRFPPLPDLTRLNCTVVGYLPVLTGPRPFRSCSIPGSFFRIRSDWSFSDTSSSRTDLRLNQRPRQPVDPRGQFMVRPAWRVARQLPPIVLPHFSVPARDATMAPPGRRDSDRSIVRNRRMDETKNASETEASQSPAARFEWPLG